MGLVKNTKTTQKPSKVKKTSKIKKEPTTNIEPFKIPKHDQYTIDNKAYFRYQNPHEGLPMENIHVNILKNKMPVIHDLAMRMGIKYTYSCCKRELCKIISDNIVFEK